MFRSFCLCGLLALAPTPVRTANVVQPATDVILTCATVRAVERAPGHSIEMRLADHTGTIALASAQNLLVLAQHPRALDGLLQLDIAVSGVEVQHVQVPCS